LKKLRDLGYFLISAEAFSFSSR